MVAYFKEETMYLEISNPMDYHVALYIRLSKEDETEGPSQSVTNQKSLLNEFVQQHRLSVYDTYVDDGWSGTSFDRPDFQRMIEDIEAKKVNMVITKDLSRLGRDYIMTGHYMERYFPEKRVRYISLLDGIDTGVESTANDITPFRAIMNDMYAKDISKNGTSSIAYAKAKAAMNAETKWTIKLTNGQTMQYRIIGINHDDLTNGSGKAGITFLATSRGIEPDITWSSNSGGWEKSELRQMMNSGEIWNLMPSDFQSKVKSVRKLTNNVDGTDKNAAVTATSDKLFLLSYSEIVPTSYWASSYPWTSSEGTQYEAFKGKVTNNYSGNDCLKIGNYWWERSAGPGNSYAFLSVNSDGDPSYNDSATNSNCVCPAFSF